MKDAHFVGPVLIAIAAYMTVFLVVGMLLKTCDREISDLDDIKRRNEK